MNSRIATANYPGRPTRSISAGLIALTLITAGCTSTQSVQEPAVENIPSQPESKPLLHALVDTDWKAVSILGRPAGSAVSTLGFSADGRVAGNGGCNGYQGDVTLTGQAIAFGMLATTRMMCAPPVGGQETAFLETLELARSWERSGQTLELIDDGNEVVLKLTQQEVD